MLTVKQYETDLGQSPFTRWLDDLNSPAAAKVTAAIMRLANGNFGDVKAVGLEFVSDGSILDLDTGSILGETENKSSFFLAEAARKANRRISQPLLNVGRITNGERVWEADNGSDTRFQTNGSG